MTRAIRNLRVVLAAICMLAATSEVSDAFGIPLSSTQAQVWVAGRQVAFSHLGIAYGDPVAPIDDPGISEMLAMVGAKVSWQPGTRFAAITRADGSLITFTLGSNAVSVDGTPAPMPFAAFSVGTTFYAPLLPLAKALDLGVRGFRSGYVFVPQVVSVVASVDARRTTVHISGSAPMTWRSTFAAQAARHTVSLAIPGFGTDTTGLTPVKGRDASAIDVSESGPPGYPTTIVVVSVAKNAKFVTRRSATGVDLVIARSTSFLRPPPPIATPQAVRVTVAPIAQTPVPSAQPLPTPAAAPVTPQASAGSASPSPETSGVPTAEPLGPEPSPTGSLEPSPAPSAPDQKITDISVTDTGSGTRITLTVTGPVTFEWHRLADPDDRYWLDIDHAQLVGPAQTLSSTLPFIKEIKVSQHLLVPEKVVRVSITPTQAIEVNVGQIQGMPDQLGIEIENQPPPVDAATSGMGALGVALATPTAAPSGAAGQSQVDQDLIVIDPGHGGTDPGSSNSGYGLVEKSLTLQISQRLEADLRKQGWKVTMTRVGDYDVGDPDGPDAAELQARCDVANAAGARLFVSVHINASVSSAPNGTTTYFWHPGDQEFAQDVQNDVVAATGIADDGVIRDSFYVIHHTVMPSVLVEAAYLSNDHDAQLLTQSSFLDKIAAGIARGIADFTGGPPQPVGQTGRSH